MSEMPSAASDARPSRELTVSEWRRKHLSAQADMMALSNAWRRQREPNDEVRDAIQQCADELVVLVMKMGADVYACCSRDE